MQPRSDPRHPVHTQVPHLEAEDKLISLGPLELTLRQAGLLFAGGWVAFILWKACAGLAAWGMVGLALRLLLVALPGLLALAFAFGSLGGRRYETWITIIWRYLRQPKIAVWHRLPQSAQAQEETPVSSTTRESEA